MDADGSNEKKISDIDAGAFPVGGAGNQFDKYSLVNPISRFQLFSLWK
jgi:hypothetical protein